ncbi:MAG: polysaccharide biosynthesis protein [Epsilonproteobacteria bacterium]|nr:polysaccharide biosynthesis protein [Campylobacterota bacterium]
MRLSEFFKPTFAKRVAFFVLSDIVLSVFTIYLSYLLRFNFDIPSDFLKSMTMMMLFLIPIKIVSLFFYKIYFVTWRFFGLAEYKKIVLAHIVSYTVFTTIFLLFQNSFLPFPRSVIAIDLFLSLFFIGFLRISRRLYMEGKQNEDFKRCIVYGSSPNALRVIKSCLDGEIKYHPVAVISSEKRLAGTYLSNIKVYGKEDIQKVAKENRAEAAIISDELDRKSLDGVVKKLHSCGIRDIKISQILKEEQKTLLQDISIEDLLAREPKDLDKKAIEGFVRDKVVLITGAGGSIGSELSRQCVKFGAEKVLLLDHSEYNLYKIEQELEGENIVAILQSVANIKLLEKTFQKYDIDIVLHAAAYKHVPLVEDNVEEAVLNNIIGTKNCMDLSVKYKVKKFVMISTDKAVRPTNVMGATKRVCELYGQNIDAKDTDIVSVRFGNVLGSSGSVIPKFKKQIENGGPITVTHPDITRYFMLIPEACQLVLQAGSLGRGRDLFILDMGEPVKIVDLARKMCELSGKNDIKIVFTGLRKGEKLYEELLIDEADAKTKYDSILISKPTEYDINLLKEQIEKLLKSEDKISILKDIVPEFKHD